MSGIDANVWSISAPKMERASIYLHVRPYTRVGSLWALRRHFSWRKCSFGAPHAIPVSFGVNASLKMVLGALKRRWALLFKTSTNIANGWDLEPTASIQCKVHSSVAYQSQNFRWWHLSDQNFRKTRYTQKKRESKIFEKSIFSKWKINIVRVFLYDSLPRKLIPERFRDDFFEPKQHDAAPGASRPQAER